MWELYYNICSLTATRKKLRNEATKHEKILWEELKGKKLLGYKFRRQHSIGRYILDFYCNELLLGVEIDWDSHLWEENIKYDNLRTEYIKTANIKIIRFTNIEVEEDIYLVLEKLSKFIKTNK